MPAIGSEWDTGCGNVWRVVDHLPDGRVMVELVRCGLTGRSGDRFVWHVSSVTSGKEV